MVKTYDLSSTWVFRPVDISICDFAIRFISCPYLNNRQANSRSAVTYKYVHRFFEIKNCLQVPQALYASLHKQKNVLNMN